MELSPRRQRIFDAIIGGIQHLPKEEQAAQLHAALEPALESMSVQQLTDFGAELVRIGVSSHMLSLVDRHIADRKNKGEGRGGDA